METIKERAKKMLVGRKKKVGRGDYKNDGWLEGEGSRKLSNP